MALSVIVTSYESPATLRRCLRALSEQAEASEIVVSDCSSKNPSSVLEPEFPRVRFLWFAEPRSVPQLRWAALSMTTGDLVAAVEARCIPSRTWCADLIAGHASALGSPAVGGPVCIVDHSSSFDWALYFCEYGHFAPPVQTGPARALSGANLSYKREALERAADVIDRGEWETLLHGRWLREGLTLTLCPASVTFQNSMDVRTALAQRRHYGRGYAADRLRKKPWVLRFAFALAALGLPLLMFLRIAGDAAKKSLLTPFLRSSVWILVLNTSWSLGEIAGYLSGKPSESKIF